jgi:hypothetical protein
MANSYFLTAERFQEDPSKPADFCPGNSIVGVGRLRVGEFLPQENDLSSKILRSHIAKGLMTPIFDFILIDLGDKFLFSYGIISIGKFPFSYLGIWSRIPRFHSDKS